MKAKFWLSDEEREHYCTIAATGTCARTGIYCERCFISNLDDESCSNAALISKYILDNEAKSDD